MLKKILAGLTAAVLSLGVVALVAGPASAHHNTISASPVSCTTAGYTVTWSVTNSESGKTEEIKESSDPSLVPVGTVFAQSETKTFVQTFTSPRDVTLTLKGFWADGSVYTSNAGSIAAAQFPTGCLEATPTVSKVQPVCDSVTGTYTDPSYTLGGVGVAWFINGNPTASGTYTVKVGVPIRAEAKAVDPRYKLVGTTAYDYTFQDPAGPCTKKVVPVEPKITQQACTAVPGDHSPATYTLPAVTGILYSVKLDGGAERTVAAGTYTIADGVKTIQVIARGDAANNYEIEGGSKVFDVVTLNAVGECLVDTGVIKPEFDDAVCLASAPGEVPPSTYTLFYVEHVIYQVSTNGGAAVDRVITEDTTFTAEPGDTITVTIRADDPTKYQTPAYNESHTFTDPGDCKLQVTPVTPTVTNQYCDDSLLSDGGADATAAAATVGTGALLAAPVTVSGTIVIPVTPNVTYYIDGVVAPAGPNTVANGDHIITVSYDTGKFVLDPAVTVPFTVTIAAGECLPTEPLVTPAAASKALSCFSNGSYTLANDLNDPAAVLWTVNGKPASAGTYTVTGNSSVTIAAAPNAPAYGFGAGAQTSWTFGFTKPAGCDLETLALTGQSPMGLLVLADAFVVGGLSLFGLRALRRNRSRLLVD